MNCPAGRHRGGSPAFRGSKPDPAVVAKRPVRNGTRRRHGSRCHPSTASVERFLLVAGDPVGATLAHGRA